MTVQEFYEKVGGSYNDVFARFGNENIIVHFLKMLLKDNTIIEFKTAVNEMNIDMAFRSAHTMKGTLSNLGLTALFNRDFEIVELLRRRDLDGALVLIPAFLDEYKKTTAEIELL